MLPQLTAALFASRRLWRHGTSGGRSHCVCCLASCWAYTPRGFEGRAFMLIEQLLVGRLCEEVAEYLSDRMTAAQRRSLNAPPPGEIAVAAACQAAHAAAAALALLRPALTSSMPLQVRAAEPYACIPETSGDQPTTTHQHDKALLGSTCPPFFCMASACLPRRSLTAV